MSAATKSRAHAGRTLQIKTHISSSDFSRWKETNTPQQNSKIVANFLFRHFTVRLMVSHGIATRSYFLNLFSRFTSWSAQLVLDRTIEHARLHYTRNHALLLSQCVSRLAIRKTPNCFHKLLVLRFLSNNPSSSIRNENSAKMFKRE